MGTEKSATITINAGGRHLGTQRGYMYRRTDFADKILSSTTNMHGFDCERRRLAKKDGIMKPTQDRKDAQVEESSPTIRTAKVRQGASREPHDGRMRQFGGFVTLRAACAAQRQAAGHANLSLSSGIGAAWRCGNSSLLVVFAWYLMRGKALTTGPTTK
ncbi:hypothetical protein Landi51_13670 [Colletotrichum acutatum]